MTWDSVPWFVGGGAHHSPEVARLLAYAAMRANEGTMGPSDLKVSALAVPGGSVAVAPGACAITVRTPGYKYQTYAGRLVSQDTVAIAPTSASGPRHDLIVARVEDPTLAGESWAAPADPTVGPYVFTRVISGVPAGTKSVAALGLGYSAIALARIDIPASTGAITNGMITDLRKVANPRRETVQFSGYPSGQNDLNSSGYTTWPGLGSWAIDVPEWAVAAIVTASWGQVLTSGGNATGDVRVNLGGQTSQAAGWDNPNASGSARSSIIGGGDITIPANLRGTTQTLTLQGRRNTGSGLISADTKSTVIVNVTFLERAE